jgi:predicted enzyme involved in methoxymalonyl-ACP biosynthesis
MFGRGHHLRLGRQMERFMFDRLVEAAIGRRLKTLIGVYRPTAKNGLVAGHYEQMGFTRNSETQEEIRYEYAVPEHPLITAIHVRNTTTGSMAQHATQ